jgi:hypothetical protein
MFFMEHEALQNQGAVRHVIMLLGENTPFLPTTLGSKNEGTPKGEK